MNLSAITQDIHLLLALEYFSYQLTDLISDIFIHSSEYRSLISYALLIYGFWA